MIYYLKDNLILSAWLGIIFRINYSSTEFTAFERSIKQVTKIGGLNFSTKVYNTKKMLSTLWVVLLLVAFG